MKNSNLAKQHQSWEAYLDFVFEIVHLDENPSFTHDPKLRDLESFLIDGLEE